LINLGNQHFHAFFGVSGTALVVNILMGVILLLEHISGSAIWCGFYMSWDLSFDTVLLFLWL